MAERSVVVFGATSLVGSWLLGELAAAGLDVHAVSRRPMPPAGVPDPVRWHRWDAGASDLPSELAAPYCVSLLPLWLLPPLIEPLARRGLRRLIAFSSTSALSKADSSVESERHLAARLREAESRLAALCDDSGVAWTIFRPTMIYGGGRDKNIAEIARFIGRFGFFPIVGTGRGLRQPVHGADLAHACLLALDEPRTHAKRYVLSGATALTYRQLVEQIFFALRRKPRIVSLPRALIRPLLPLARMLRPYRQVNEAMLRRMGQDLAFEHADAVRDFGYCPRPFDPGNALRGEP